MSRLGGSSVAHVARVARWLGTELGDTATLLPLFLALAFPADAGHFRRFRRNDGATTTITPVATSVAASSVTGISATLNGTGDPNGSSATGWFRYWSSDPGSCSDSGGTRVPTEGGDALGVGSSRVDLQACKLEYSIVSPK